MTVTVNFFYQNSEYGSSPGIEYRFKFKICYDKNPTIPTTGWNDFDRDNLIDFSGYSNSGAGAPVSVTMQFP